MKKMITSVVAIMMMVISGIVVGQHSSYGSGYSSYGESSILGTDVRLNDGSTVNVRKNSYGGVDVTRRDSTGSTTYGSGSSYGSSSILGTDVRMNDGSTVNVREPSYGGVEVERRSLW